MPPPLAVFNHLTGTEWPNPKRFIRAVCPSRTWQAKGQEIESNKLKEGKVGGSRTETAGLGSREGDTVPGTAGGTV